MRTAARETVFKILFSEQFGTLADENFKAGMYRAGGLNADDVAYCNNIIGLVHTYFQELTSIIDKHSYSFPEVRLFPADRCILTVALSEILYCGDIPDKVAVNEAANIASKYSSEKSASFISGILASVIGDKNV
ncbi:MAG: transcription antitermination protein NusB [Clostridia bacterium]|nr:transcription antitermination protein NusB [Clostridia bacterium]